MTNQEAIEYFKYNVELLQDVIDYNKNHNPDNKNEKVLMELEADRAAINALKEKAAREESQKRDDELFRMLERSKS